MYTRKAEKVRIVFTERGEHIFIKASLTLHDSWLEVKGRQVDRDYVPAVGDPKWGSKAVRGTIVDGQADHIYPESAIKYIDVNNKKVDLRHFKKGKL